MNAVDLILLICLIWAALKGWKAGLLRSLAGLVGLILAYGLALSYGGTVANWLVGDSAGRETGAALVGFLSVFLVTLTASYIAVRILHKMLHATPLGLFDTIGGGAVGLAKGLLILGLLLFLARAYPLHSRVPGYIAGSAFGPPVQRSALFLIDAIRAAVPSAASLYSKLGPPAQQPSHPPIVDTISDRANEARARLDSLVEDSRKALESK